MQRQLLAYKDIVHGGYAVMVCVATGTELADIRKYENIYHFETMDDVKKMAEALNGIIERWGDDGKSAETDADTGSDGRRVQGCKESDSVHRRLGAAEKGSVYAKTESKQ